MLNIICTARAVIVWCAVITGAAQHSYRMVRSLSHAVQLPHGAQLIACRAVVAWAAQSVHCQVEHRMVRRVLIYRDIYRL